MFSQSRQFVIESKPWETVKKYKDFVQAILNDLFFPKIRERKMRGASRWKK